MLSPPPSVFCLARFASPARHLGISVVVFTICQVPKRRMAPHFTDSHLLESIQMRCHQACKRLRREEEEYDDDYSTDGDDHDHDHDHDKEAERRGEEGGDGVDQEDDEDVGADGESGTEMRVHRNGQGNSDGRKGSRGNRHGVKKGPDLVLLTTIFM